MVATVTKSKVSMLELVYPPISNQEAVQLQHDPEVEALLRESDFYMIGGRAEARFTDIAVDQTTHVMNFNMTVADIKDPVQLHLKLLPGVAEAEVGGYWLEAGE